MEDSDGAFETFKENLTARFSDWIEAKGNPSNFSFLIFGALTFDLLIWGVTLSFPEVVSRFFDLVGWSDLLTRILFLTVFFVNFLLFYALIRKLVGDASPVDVEDGPLKGYAESAGSDRRWKFWVGAGMLSALHTIIFFAIGILGGKEYQLVIP